MKNGEENFKEFYIKNLGDSEFSNLFESLKIPLPKTFRISSTSPFKYLIEKILNNYTDFVEKINWMDNCYQISKVKNSNKYNEFMKFLIYQTDMGNIYRQELVSMIPVLLMDIKPDSRVIDLCASPGSKSLQILELLDPCKGLLISNDINRHRVDILITQTSKLPSLGSLITFNDAMLFPNIIINDKHLKFDRVLCDVPCSSDGTIRKQKQVLDRWSIRTAQGLFKEQYRILCRGAQLLDENGILVYSTCSLNPIENEAVIQKFLLENNRNGNTFELVPSSLKIKTRPGMTYWHPFSDDESHRPCGKNLGLEKCIRIYPQDQNTGGFFIAVLQKIKKTDSRKEQKIKGKDVSLDTKIRQYGKESPFYNVYIKKEIEDYYKCILPGRLITQSEGLTSISIINEMVYDILLNAKESLQVISAGFKGLVLNNFHKSHDGSYRIKSALFKYLKEYQRVIDISIKDFERLLENEFVGYNELEIRSDILGGVIITCGIFIFSGWSTKAKLGLFINKRNRIAIKQLLVIYKKEEYNTN
ncbi:tRNA (cytosine(34)-C(5))-methyltransferase [Astathelohania contejeani]|uniref:tRNA (Cytosine(34)-C(5))-methyltransferase n=1 Tax=Astathelohania contejeani TaxID=164912 RepID=A0ABQ7I263_9MICR|nr:tRNA (cytosine(34)-C(5))-methyltransferase [Thelohania contejeani]